MLPRWLSLHGRALCLGFGAAVVPGLLGGCDPTGHPGLLQPAGTHRPLIKPEPAPPALGTYVNGFVNAQAHKAEADDFIIYGYEWLKQGATTGPWGTAHLRRIAARLPHEAFPVLIEDCNGDAALNESRRKYVISFLRDAGVGDADLRVIVGGSPAGGLYGEEIQPLYQGFVSRQRAGYGGMMGGLGNGVPGFGTPPFVPQVPFGGGFGGFGGFGGGGFGGFGGFR